jgi:hypothetical protein
MHYLSGQAQMVILRPVPARGIKLSCVVHGNFRMNSQYFHPYGVLMRLDIMRFQRTDCALKVQVLIFLLPVGVGATYVTINTHVATGWQSDAGWTYINHQDASRRSSQDSHKCENMALFDRSGLPTTVSNLTSLI